MQRRHGVDGRRLNRPLRRKPAASLSAPRWPPGRPPAARRAPWRGRSRA
jgi:hypothetical protein